LFAWSLSSPLGRRRRSLGHAFVVEPVLLVVIEWVDQVGHQLVLLCYLNHSSCVLVPAAVVSGRENSEKLASSESFEAIHHALVRAQYKFNFIVF